MKRRAFITLLGGGVAATWPIETRAQRESKVPTVGWLSGGTQSDNAAAFVEGLQEAGYTDGRNLRIEQRSYGTNLNLARGLAEELVRLQCSVIFATNPYAIQTAMNATRVIPIVGLDLESDPVANGWVNSLSRPGGNLTGFFLDIPELSGKQIELLKETLPMVRRLGVIWDSTIGSPQFLSAEVAARAMRIDLQSLPIQNAADFNNAFDRAKNAGTDGVVILPSSLIFVERTRIAELALNAQLPTIGLFTQFPKAGGLMAYGPKLTDMFKRGAVYVDRIVKGEKAAELPVERPTKFEFVINLKTAKALGITVPPTLLGRADEVIE